MRVEPLGRRRASTPAAKKRRAKRLAVPLEDSEARSLVLWLNRAGLVYTHVPNEQQQRLLAVGVRPGFPDYLVFTRPPADPGAPGCAIELKRIEGGKLEKEQEQWLERLRNLGWHTFVAEGYREAVDFLVALGYRPG